MNTKKEFPLFLFILLIIFSSCQSNQEGKDEEEQNTSESTPEEKEDNTTPTSAKSNSDKDDLFLELSFKGGTFDGKTMMFKPRYSAEDQATIEEGEITSMEFTRVVDSEGLQVSLELTWLGGFSEGEKDTQKSESEINIYNANKDSKYDFERLVISFEETNLKLSKVGEWKGRASNDAAIFEGEGKVTKSIVEKFTSQFESTKEPSVEVSFKYRARAIKY